MIKQYHFDYDNGQGSVHFIVDTEKFTPDLAKATLEFFDWRYDEDNDPVDEVLNKYAIRAIRVASEGKSTYGVQEDFKDAEGYAAVDGSMGITLGYVNGYEFDVDLLEVEIN